MNKEFKNPGMMRVPSDLEMPKGHEGYSLQDKEKCPYFQIQEKTKDIPEKSASFFFFIYKILSFSR